MLPSRRSLTFACSSSRSGFTRTELLVGLSLMLIVTALTLVGPLRHYLHHARMTGAVENARTLNTLLAQYATDNNDTYPVGQGTPVEGRSEGIARNLLDGKYAQDPVIFALGSATTYDGTATDFSDFTAANVGWDFTGGATATTGLTPKAPDALPTVYATGETVTYPTTPGVGLNLSLSGSGPFAKEGTVVGYKDNSASFIKGTESGGAIQAVGFISTSFTDSGTYTQIKP